MPPCRLGLSTSIEIPIRRGGHAEKYGRLGQVPARTGVKQRKLGHDPAYVTDPISASGQAGQLSLTGGHHRTAEIARRVASGQLPPDTTVRVLLHD